MRSRGLVVFFVAASAVLFGCSRSSTKGGNGRQRIAIKGSDTMVHLVSSLAEAFMKTHLDIEIAVTGGGSGTGIAALLNKTTDICMSSRALDEKEKQLAQQKGIQPGDFAIGLDGIAVIVHPSNPIQSMTLQQLKSIYTGQEKNWKAFGGADQKILVLSRESNSGTYVFFQEHVLQKADFAAYVRLMSASSAILQSVTTDKSAIGYLGLGYAVKEPNIKILKVRKSDKDPAVEPSHAAIKSGAYPISRPLFLYTNGFPSSGPTKAFLDFCMSQAGQTILQASGYVPFH